jgi:glycosyltransferase involved in cell wall biosynthesis
MNDTPKVSVVVVFYDTRQFLAEALDSVLRQSYTEWELLLVDDGSTDGSDTIAREYAERDDRILYLHHPGRSNRGISASRNLGLAQARGVYLAQLDSDDVWLPSHLEHHVAMLDAHPAAAMVYGPVERWYSWTGDPEDVDRDFVARPLDRYDTCIQPPTLVRTILKRQYGVPLGFLARRDAMQAVGGYEDEFRGMYDDQVFFCKLGLKYPVYVTRQWSYRYRRHQESIVWVTNYAGEKLHYRKLFLNWLTGYLSEEGIRDPRIWKSLMEERWKCRHPRLEEHRQSVVDLSARILRRLRRIWSAQSASQPS